MLCGIESGHERSNASPLASGLLLLLYFGCLPLQCLTLLLESEQARERLYPLIGIDIDVLGYG